MTHLQAAQELGVDHGQSWGSLPNYTRIQLAPVRICESDGQALIFGTGSGTSVRTNRMGVEAVKLLQRGKSIGAVKAELGNKYGYEADRVDLTPLLHSLASRQLILKMGDINFSIQMARFGPGVWSSLQSGATSSMVSCAIRYLPLSLAIQILYRAATAKKDDSGHSTATGLIAANLSRASCLAVAEQECKRLSQENWNLVQRTYIDRLLLAALSGRRIRRWLQEYFVLEGKKSLDNVTPSGRPIILCGFHTGSYSLLPFILAASGYPITVLAHTGTEGGAAAAKAIQRSRMAGLDLDLTIVSGNFAIRCLRRAVEHGRIALILPDVLETKQRAHGAPVSFLGFRVHSSAGLGWLCQRLDAIVFPVHLCSQTDGHHIAKIEDPITMNGASSLTAAVYQKLEMVIRKNPQQWMRWIDFHKFIGEEP